MRHDYNAEGLDGTTRAAQNIGFVMAHKFGGSVFAEEVIVEEEGGNSLTWNVTLDGNELFAQTQSVTSGTTPESFIPDQNRHASGDLVELGFQATNQESGSQEINIGVSLSTGEE